MTGVAAPTLEPETKVLETVWVGAHVLGKGRERAVRPEQKFSPQA